MNKITDIKNLKGKRVLLRADFNVPLSVKGEVLDDTRIRAEIPTINYLLSKGAKVIICSHLGRPNGCYEPGLSLFPVAVKLMKYFPERVKFSNKVVGVETEKLAKNLKEGEILLIENLRFEKGEEECDMIFAKKLAKLAEIFVNDAFGVIHRKHASNYGVATLLPSYYGFLIDSEVTAIENVYDHPKHPLIAVLGGAKVEDKVKVINRLLEVCDTIIIGGGMAYTFLEAKGVNIGDSLVSTENIGFAKKVITKAEKLGKKILLPIDHVVLCGGKVKKVEQLERGMVGYDIGKKTIKLFIEEINRAEEIIWNGPLGKYEDKRFSKGTFKIAKAIAKSNAYSLVGGGDSVAAINSCGLSNKISHLSTGGGATLKLMEGAYLDSLEVIREKQ